jgi:hypothetical protein
MNWLVEMCDPGFTVICHVGPAHELDHLSKVVTGLCELAEGGSIELQLKPAIGDPALQKTAVMHATIVRAGHSKEVAFDVHDRSDRFDMELLRRCDVYWKRSFRHLDIEKLPAVGRSTVAPLGLNHACQSASGESRLFSAKLDLGESLNGYRNLLSFADFEQGPDIQVDPMIVFQTRAWAPGSTSDDTEVVNESRAQIIQALRKAFPNRFHGGFARTPFARQLYPELISPYPDQQGAYLDFCKRHLIGISSRGLHHSEPFKLAEYMAASMAIVSAPMRSALHAPIVDGVDFLEFRKAEECVAMCDRLLTNPALAAELRQASWQRYLSEVHPARQVENLMQRAFNRSPALPAISNGPRV